METKRPRSDLTRPFVVNGFALIEELAGSVSPRPDGERVSVVGQDCPSSPDLAAFVSFEPRSVQAVAAFEVTDPAFGTGSVAPQSALGASAAGLLSAGDEHPLRGEGVRERLAVVGPRLEATVERDLAGSDPEPGQLAEGVGQQRVLGRVPQPGRGRDDQSARSAPWCARSLPQIWLTYPNSVGLAELALADRPGVRVGERHEPIGDRLPGDPLLDLGRDLLAPIRELLQRRRRPALGRRATPHAPGAGRPPRAFAPR